jgi:hypothetical protein
MHVTAHLSRHSKSSLSRVLSDTSGPAKSAARPFSSDYSCHPRVSSSLTSHIYAGRFLPRHIIPTTHDTSVRLRVRSGPTTHCVSTQHRADWPYRISRCTFRVASSPTDPRHTSQVNFRLVHAISIPPRPTHLANSARGLSDKSLHCRSTQLVCRLRNSVRYAPSRVPTSPSQHRSPSTSPVMSIPALPQSTSDYSNRFHTGPEPTTPLRIQS